MACPQCGHVISATPGTRANCPGCGFSDTVPGAPPRPAQQSAPPQPAAPAFAPPPPSGGAAYGTPQPLPYTPGAKPPPTETVAIVGLILNLMVLPGLGTLIGGRTTEGIWQIVLVVVGFVLMIILIGFFALLAAWIWAIVSSVQILQEAQAAKHAGYTR